MRSEEYCTIVKEHEINMKGRVESKKNGESNIEQKIQNKTVL